MSGSILPRPENLPVIDNVPAVAGRAAAAAAAAVAAAARQPAPAIAPRLGRRSARARAGLLALAVAGAGLLGVSTAPAQTAESRVGDIVVGEVRALPTLAGNANGVAYIGRLANTGSLADRLLRASTPVAARVELHTMALDANAVMRMRAADAIALAAKSEVRMRPGEGFHLMLMQTTRPLREGDTFPLTLEFERAGRTEVAVVVQARKPLDGAGAGHKH